MIFSYFTDPVLRAPVLGSLFMCLAASLMGALAFLKKRSLLGEAISHAAYPGVVFGFLCAAWLRLDPFFFCLSGALLFSLLGLLALEWLEKKARVKSDAALCYLLASFFGMGVLAVSYLQAKAPSFAAQVQLYLYGQAATMTDLHLALYVVLALVVVLFLLVSFRPLQAVLFDQQFSQMAQIGSRALSGMLFLLFLSSIIMGIRSVGIILMSGMLIAPAVAARAYTERFGVFLILSGVFGVLSGFLGVVLSVERSLPTGPVIVCVGAVLAISSLLFAPKRGVVARAFRIFSFRKRCREENILKAIWKRKTISRARLKETQGSLLLPFLLFNLRRQGWIVLECGEISLTQDGERRASQIVRLHRLWETYLADLGWPLERVHKTAEEMEHILTPEFEERLVRALRNPKVDPHEKPIPEKV